MDPKPAKASSCLNKDPCDINREIPENIFGMLLSSIVYTDPGPSSNLIAEVTIGPRVAYMSVFVGFMTPSKSPLVEYPAPNLVLRSNF
jgi:hypothetical protein